MLKEMLTMSHRIRRVAIATTVVAAGLAAQALAGGMVQHAGGDYTYGDHGCSRDNLVDPINFRWGGKAADSYLQGDTRANLVGLSLDKTVPHFGPVHGGTQYVSFDDGCAVMNGQEGKEFGPPVNGIKHGEKIHVRLFGIKDDGDALVVGDAHREHKAACYVDSRHPEKGTHGSDAVYVRYNGANGFSAAARRIYLPYQAKHYLHAESHTPAVFAVYQCLKPGPHGAVGFHGDERNRPVIWRGDTYWVSLP